MAKLFIGLALALMVATAVLGFLANSNIGKLQSTLKGTKSALTTSENRVTAVTADLKKATEEKEAADAKTKEATAALEVKNGELDSAKKENEAAKSLVEAKTQEIAKLNDDLMKARNNPMPDGPKGEDPRIAELTNQLQQAQQQLAEAKVLAETISNQSKANEVKLAEAEKREKMRQNEVVRPGLSGRILAVNAGWNFVVLSVGDKQGVLVNAPLLVVRGNEPIARLRITSVEPSTSIADVIPGSVRKGISVQPGDTVIFEGRQPSTTPKAPVETAAPQPALPN